MLEEIEGLARGMNLNSSCGPKTVVSLCPLLKIFTFSTGLFMLEMMLTFKMEKKTITYLFFGGGNMHLSI